MRIQTNMINEKIKRNNLSGGQLTAINCVCDCEVVRETEKAYYLRWDTKFGSVSMWCPKSCIGTEMAITDTYNEYDDYFKRAKDAGVKGIRYKMKMSTIAIKAEEQGKKF